MDSISSPSCKNKMHNHNAVHCAGLLCAILYGLMAFQSNQNPGLSLNHFLGLYWSIAATVGLLALYLFRFKQNLSFTILIAWSIIFRLIAIYGSPIMEDDFYRFLLDGCTFQHFGTPYGITPQSLFSSNDLSASCQWALNWVNNPDLPTIYGPVLQYLFLISHLISPANIDVLQTLLGVFDIVLILLLRSLVKSNWLLLYAWNPLVLKEFAFSAHPDVVGIVLLLAALLAWRKDQNNRACVLIALACGSKIFALIALPFILYKQRPEKWLLFAMTLGLLYTPFILNGNNEFSVLGVFADRWVFNPLGFYAASHLTNDQIARYLCLILFSLIWSFYFLHFQKHHNMHRSLPRFDWLFGAFLLLSPVVNAWYLLWIFPFALIKPSYWAFSLTVAAPLTYVTGLQIEQSNLGAYQIHKTAYTLQVLIIAIALILDFSRYGIAKSAQTTYRGS